jgi:hypothetical protein
MHGGPDLTPGVQVGLGVFFLLLAFANGFMGSYQLFQGNTTRWPWIWFGFMFLCLPLGAMFCSQAGFVIPQSFRDTMDLGLARGLVTLGLSPGSVNEGWRANDYIVLAFQVALYFALLLWLIDAMCSYVLKGEAAQNIAAVARRIVCHEDPAARMIIWWLVVSVIGLIIYGTGAVTYFTLANAAFAAVLYWRKPLTEPNIAWLILILSLLVGGLFMTDYDFRTIIMKPDNVPIVFLVYSVLYFTWLALRIAVLNDDRIAKGEPPLEKLEDEKVLVWPDLVYTELICMVVVTALLIVWALALPAPLEEPANATKTPNPSKAPWYFLGLQEMLVYYDPWLAGVVFPTLIIVGLMAIPYIDFNQKGNGYYTFNERAFSIIAYLYGFIVLWVILIFLGTFLRGPNWNFFGLFEYWDPHKLVPLNNVNLSEYFWIRGLGINLTHPADGVSLGVILLRELPGILLVIGYFLLLPPILARTVFRSFFIRMGFIRYMIFISLVLFTLSLPLKMILRWTINLKYIVAIPEFFFHI